MAASCSAAHNEHGLQTSATLKPPELNPTALYMVSFLSRFGHGVLLQQQQQQAKISDTQNLNKF